jgi:hypothetical protein
VKVKDNAASITKAIAKDPISHRHDSDVIATWVGGDFTAGKLATIIFSDQRGAQLSQQIQTLPDSIIRRYVEQMAQRELLLKRADSAKMGPTPEQMASLHRDFVQAVSVAQQSLRIDPKSLADSAKTPAERERLAASRVEAFLDKVMAGEAQPLPVPAPLQIVLMDKYEYKLNTAGVDRAVERAQKIRVVADSSRAANQPKSAVPLPGAPGAAPGAAPGQTAPPTGAVPTPPAGKPAPTTPPKP